MKPHISYKRFDNKFYWLVYNNKDKDRIDCMSIKFDDIVFWVNWMYDDKVTKIGLVSHAIN